MENYVTPEEQGRPDQPQDLLNASMLFARALGLIFKEDEGIVVDITGDVVLGDDVNKVIVFKKDEQVHIFKFEEDLPEGTMVSLNPPTDEQTEELEK